MWGIKAPEGKVASWGARAIFKSPQGIDLLGDRQEIAGTKKARSALAVWINTSGLPGLKAELEKQDVGARETKDVQFREGGYVIVGNPRSSGGYLYLGAWPEGAT